MVGQDIEGFHHWWGPGITLNDLQTLFAPESEIVMDQNGFGIINAHTNVYASTYRPQTQTQTMLGQQVTLRITPVRWEISGEQKTRNVAEPRTPGSTAWGCNG